MKVVFTGGGTGGHVFPLVAIAREIRRIYPKNNLNLFYIGPKDELSRIYLSQEDFEIKTIISGKVRRYFSFENIIDIIFKIPMGFLQSLFMLMDIKPSLVFSKGGSGSISVTYAAKFLNIPVFIHESDVVPGRSNQVASKWAKKIFTSFPKTEYFNPESVICVGNPIRKELLEGDGSKAGDLLGLSFTKPILLVSGGSQGAGAINDFVLLILNDLLKDFEVIHVAGESNVKDVKAEAQVVIDKNLEKYYHLAGFFDEQKMKHIYKATDFIISRSGSGSIFEIAALGKPSLLVPLPSAAGDHQSKNAYSYAETGAAVVLEQNNLTKNFFLQKMDLMFLNSQKADEMRKAALDFSKPLAGRAVAREILEFLMLE